MTPWHRYSVASMIALPPTTATASGSEPWSIAGRMNSVSTAKLAASPTSASSPRSRPTTTTASAKAAASTTSGTVRRTSTTLYCNSRGAWGAWATTTSWPAARRRVASGVTISGNVWPASSPSVTSTVAFRHVPPSRGGASAAPPPGPGCPPAALTSSQSTSSTAVTRAENISRS